MKMQLKSALVSSLVAAGLTLACAPLQAQTVLRFASEAARSDPQTAGGEKMNELLKAKTGAHEVIVSNLRHYEALVHAREAILRVQEGLEQQVPGDLLAQDIRECLWYLGSITGDISEDEVLGYIFKNFCIGK